MSEKGEKAEQISAIFLLVFMLLFVVFFIILIVLSDIKNDAIQVELQGQKELCESQSTYIAQSDDFEYILLGYHALNDKFFTFEGLEQRVPDSSYIFAFNDETYFFIESPVLAYPRIESRVSSYLYNEYLTGGKKTLTRFEVYTTFHIYRESSEFFLINGRQFGQCIPVAKINDDKLLFELEKIVLSMDY